MIKNAIEQGINVSYILSWFTHEEFVRGVKETGLDVIGMLKDIGQKYVYKDKTYSLKGLEKLICKENISKIGSVLGSITVNTKNCLTVKLTFIKNRNKKREFLAILSANLFLPDHEIVRIYGNRWSIEVSFKAIKSLMKLGNEFEGRNYGLMISHTTNCIYKAYTS